MTKLPKILIAEDEAIVRFDISEHLIQNGFDVLEASNSSEAFGLLDANPDVSVLLTDIDMPGALDGLMLAKFAAERWPGIGIVVISGERNAEVTDLPDGAVFIPKPCELSDVLEAVRSFGTIPAEPGALRCLGARA